MTQIQLLVRVRKSNKVQKSKKSGRLTGNTFYKPFIDNKKVCYDIPKIIYSSGHYR